VPQFKDQYGVLYDGLITKAIFKRNFNLFFIGRKILIAISIVFLSNTFYLLQISFIDLINILFLMFLSTKLPYKDFFNNIAFIISEIAFFVFLTLFSVWTIFEYIGEDFIIVDKMEILSWFVAVLILISIASRFGFTFIECIRTRKISTMIPLIMK